MEERNRRKRGRTKRTKGEEEEEEGGRLQISEINFQNRLPESEGCMLKCKN